MFSIEMLPALEGDALWIEYGDPQAPNRFLIDMGYKSTYRVVMDRLRADKSIVLELMVVTHIDRDHIAGAVPFLADRDVTAQRLKQVWFNGREQISDDLGVRHGYFFTRNINDKRFGWNSPFDGRAVVVPEGGPSDPIPLDGGMRLTVLSPGPDQLRDLNDHWTDELDDLLDGRSLDELPKETPPAMQPDLLGSPKVKTLAQKAFEPDRTDPNGSSIALLAEYDDPFDGGKTKRVLFAGDAHSSVLENSISSVLT